MLSFVIETDVRVFDIVFLSLDFILLLKTRRNHVVKKSAPNFFALFFNHSCATLQQNPKAVELGSCLLWTRFYRVE